MAVSWPVFPLLVVLLVPFYLSACLATSVNIDEDADAYNLMPPLYLYENVTECFERHSDGLYCAVKTVIHPDSASAIWRAIEKFSKLPSYHEHSLLDRGLCVNECVRLVASLDPATSTLLDTEPMRSVDPYLLLSLPSEALELSRHRTRYGKILNICANHRLWRQYNLTGHSEVERCVTTQTLRPALDAYHILFVLIVLLLVGLVVFATYKDWYKTWTTDKDGPLWMEFSLRRTWSQLIAKPRTTLQHDFAFVETLRLVAVLAILVIHVSLLYTLAPTENIRPLETVFDQPLARIATSVFPFQVHTFFTISGIMLTVHFLHYTLTKERVGWSFFGKALAMRFLRIFPTLFMVWLFQASWIDQLSRGPGDYRLFELERDNCRSNGWLNFLLVNNYFRYSSMCIQQSWHLAADFQFFLFGVPFLLLIHRHPRLTTPLILGATVYSIAAPIVNLYRWKLPAVLLVNFKHIRLFAYVHTAMKNDYMLSHVHTCSYFSGIFAGLAYHRLRSGRSFHVPGGSKTRMLLTWGPALMVLLQATLAPLFYDLDYGEPMLWNAIYGAVHRCCWGAMCAVGLLCGATSWNGRHARIHSHPLVLVLSRLSFCVFMLQFSILKSLARNATGEGVLFNWKIYFVSIVYMYVVNYAAALLLALFVEIPFDLTFKRMLRGHKQNEEKEESKDK